jgi:ribosome-binding factor A
MSSRRSERIAAVLLQEVARLLREEANDPKLPSITLTEVRLNQDFSVARILYIPLGGQEDPTIDPLLQNLAKRFRGPAGRALGIRHAPELRFELDKNFAHADRIASLLASLPPPAAD